MYVVVIHGRKTNGKDFSPWWTEATWWLLFFLKALCMIGRKIRYLKHVYISIRKKTEEDNCRYMRPVRIRRNAYMKDQWQILEIDHKEDCEQEFPKTKGKSPSPKPFNHFDRSHGF